MSASELGQAPERLRRPTRLIARTPNPGQDDWEYLEDHLVAVAKKAQAFACEFGAGDLGALLGLSHDLGKLNSAFQDYLWDSFVAERAGRRVPRRRIPHAIWGAAFVKVLLGQGGSSGSRWEEAVMPIFGHHTGLPTRSDALSHTKQFHEDQHEDFPHMLRLFQAVVQKLGTMPDRTSIPELTPTSRELRIRMLFSALVDADSLVAEQLRTNWQGGGRRPGRSLRELQERFNASGVSSAEQSSAVLRIREAVLADCLAAARRAPGIYRLAAPTGSGKTRSELAFALEHAVKNKLNRIIVALPYTSIIDQVAEEYREMLGDDAVLEHHSAMDVPAPEDEDEATLQQQLATENWDAQIIVTTTVQLFESLFTNKRSKARKLHRLARSVIILDEVQALPPGVLVPTLHVLRDLATPVEQGGYGATVVLATATQPSFAVEPLTSVFPEDGVCDIVPDPDRHYRDLRRVCYQYLAQPMTWTELASHIEVHPRVMVVLNSRPDALALLSAIGERDGVFHLSTLLCVAHRRSILEQIQERLARGLPVVLVSTQVVECGVNLDFPVVYRAMAPLDRIVQAAGRCNRHGRLDQGLVFIFHPAEGKSPGGPYKEGIETTCSVLQVREPNELHAPAVHRDYFRQLFRKVKLDDYDIQALRTGYEYPSVARGYRLIKEDTVPVVVPYGEWKTRLADWQAAPSRRAWRRLQPYLVNMYERDVERMGGILQPISDQLYVCPQGSYDIKRHRGIVGLVRDPHDLVV